MNSTAPPAQPPSTRLASWFYDALPYFEAPTPFASRYEAFLIAAARKVAM